MLCELSKGVGDSQASIRRSSAYLIGYLFKNCDIYIGDVAPNMISTLIILFSDPDSDTMVVAWQALSSVVSSVPKEVLPTYIKLVRDAASTSRDKERRKKKGGPVLIPGFCLPKALQPLLPIFLQALDSYYRTIRSSAALALGKLSALSTRVDPLVGDLLSGVQTSDVGIREATLTALKGVIKHAGGSVSIASRTRVYTLLNDLIHNDDDQIRSSAASIFELSKALLQEKLLVHNKQLCNQSVVHLLIATKKANSFQVQ